MPLTVPGIPLSALGAPNGVAQLDGTSKVPIGELPINSRQYKGTWNATTNVPALTNGTGAAGDEYIVTVAGSHDFGAGAIAFVIGDAVVYNGTIWQKSVAEYPVVEVNGKTGAVTLTAADVAALAKAGDSASGAMTFAAVSTPANPTLKLASTNPQFDMQLSNGAADSKRWNWIVGTNSITFRTVNDAGAGGANIFQVLRTGATPVLFALEIPSLVVVPANGNKLWLAKYNSGTGHSNAPTTFDASANYLQVGGREYGNNGFSGVGFGYVSSSADHPCVMIGHEEKATAGNTNGDFIIATRATTTNVAPTIQFRITAAGQILAEQASYVPGSDLALATKKYVDEQPPQGWTLPGGNSLVPATPVAQDVGSGANAVRAVYAQNIIQKPVVVTSNGTYTLSDADIILIDATAGNLTAQFDIGNSVEGKRFLFKKIDASAHTVTITLSTGAIEGQPSVVLSTRYQYVDLISAPGGVYIIGKG